MTDPLRVLLWSLQCSLPPYKEISIEAIESRLPVRNTEF
jgi:hypothetical protein